MATTSGGEHFSPLRHQIAGRFRYITAPGVVYSVSQSTMTVEIVYGRNNVNPRVDVHIAADLWRNETKENDLRFVFP